MSSCIFPSRDLAIRLPHHPYSAEFISSCIDGYNWSLDPFQNILYVNSVILPQILQQKVTDERSRKRALGAMRKDTVFQMPFLLEREIKDTDKYKKTASNGKIREKMILCQDNNWSEEIQFRPILKIR